MIDRTSGLNAAALALMVIAASPIPEFYDALEAAGLAGVHRWGLILPIVLSSRVSLLTYTSIVVARYPELVIHSHRPELVIHSHRQMQRRPAHAKPDFNWLSGP